MPLYSKVNYGRVSPLSLEGYEPGLWESVKESFSQAWGMNPTVGLANGDWAKTHKWEAGGSVFGGMDSVSQAGAAGVVGQSARGYWDAAWNEALGRDGERAQGQASDGQPEEWKPNPLAASYVPAMAEKRVRALSLAEQEELIAAAELRGEIRPHESYDEEALQIIIDAKREEKARGIVTANAPAWHAPFSFAAGIAAGMLDPINVASAFLPVVGEQRLASMLGANMANAWSRAGVRAASGAISGAVGGLVLEPFVAAQQRGLQMDYTMWNSLLNVGMGAVFGAAITPAAGRVREWRNARQGRINEFEYAQATEESNALMMARMQEIANARLQANPHLDRAAVLADAQANAVWYDEQMRHLAFSTQKPVADMYREHAYELRNGEALRQTAASLAQRRERLAAELADLESREAMALAYPELRFADADAGRTRAALEAVEFDLQKAREAAEADWMQMMGGESLYMARYSAKVNSIEDFFEWLKREDRGKQKCYYDFNGELFSRKDGLFNNAKIRLGETEVEHIKKRHAGFNDWEAIPDVLKNGNVTPLDWDNGLGGMTYVFTLNSGDKAKVVMAAVKGNKDLGYIVDIQTAFTDNSRKVENWLAQKKAALSPGVSGSLTYPSSQGATSRSIRAAGEFLANDGVEVNPSSTEIARRPDSIHIDIENAEANSTNKADRSQGALPDLLREEAAVNSPDSKTHFQLSPDSQIMGAYTAGERPIIRLFQSHDATTMPHELSHHLRRVMEKLASDSSAGKLFRDRYRSLERKYNVEPGGEWTRGQEEAFANDFVGDYLIEHKAPSADVAKAFAFMRSQALDLYESADSAGLAMTRTARDFFDNFISTPMHQGERQFRNAVEDINTRNWEREFISDADLGPAQTSPDADSFQRLQNLSEDSRQNLNQALSQAEATRPELVSQIREEHSQAMQEYQRQQTVLDEQEKIIDNLVACYLA